MTEGGARGEVRRVKNLIQERFQYQEYSDKLPEGAVQHEVRKLENWNKIEEDILQDVEAGLDAAMAARAAAD